MYFSRPATGKAPPVIASLDHLPTAWGGLFAAACRGRACPARDLTDIAVFRFVSFFILLCRQVSSPLHGGQRAGRPTNSRLRQGLYPSRGVATICGASETPPQIAFFTLRYDLFPAAVPPLLPRTASPAPASLSCWGLRCPFPLIKDIVG